MEIVVAFVREWLVSLGRDMDGDEVVGSRWEVIAETAEGRRFIHKSDFLQHELREDHDEEFGDVVVYRAELDARAEDKAEALAARVNDRKVINLEHWCETEAAYGSVAYQRHSEMRIAMFENDNS